MKQDIILAGVGGQGILSIAFVLDHAAMKQKVDFKQAEVHGMAQRGGAVQSHLRMAVGQIFSDLIPKGKADMILSVEPLEALRYVDFLSPEGIIVTSSTPYINIPDYPEIQEILAALKSTNNSIIIDTGALARKAGSPLTQNMVILGAASGRLILKEENLLEYIKALFKARGEKIVEMNLKAFRLGREAANGQNI